MLHTAFFCILLCISSHLTAFTLLLHPAGDARMVGRQIGDSVERAITLQLAEALAQQLGYRMPNIEVMLSRKPGHLTVPFHAAHLANTMQVDMVLSLHTYYYEHAKPRLHIYYVCHHPVVDFWQQSQEPLAFVAYDQAHKKHVKYSKEYATLLSNHLQRDMHLVDIQGTHGVPFKQLQGVIAPALGLELGISTPDSWKLCMPALVEALISLISHLDHGKW